MRRKWDHLEFTCIPYGFNVAANGSAVDNALNLIANHLKECPYCLGTKTPASPYGVPPDTRNDV